ncbi:MAG: thioesterase domain-containing protein [Clostridiales bacterium]
MINEKIRIYCLPYAGGSATIYNKWKKYTSENIKLIPVELAGRGRRFNEKSYENIEESVNDIFSKIRNELEESKYALFGHSMGSFLIYKLYQKILSEKLPLPIHMFFSGRYAPNRSDNKRPYHKLSDEDLKIEIKKIGGTPDEIFENHELWDVFGKILREDYRILDNHSFCKEIEKVNCNISVLTGNKDILVKDYDLNEWRNFTYGDFNLYTFDGGHFFINIEYSEIILLINHILKKYI